MSENTVLKMAVAKMQEEIGALEVQIANLATGQPPEEEKKKRK